MLNRSVLFRLLVGAVEQLDHNAHYPLVFNLKHRKAKAVRLIMTVKRNGLDDAVIQERLCDLYG